MRLIISEGQAKKLFMVSEMSRFTPTNIRGGWNKNKIVRTITRKIKIKLSMSYVKKFYEKNLII